MSEGNGVNTFNGATSRIPFTIHFPAGDITGPVITLIHGGGLAPGPVSATSLQAMKDKGFTLASRGFVAIIPEYPLYTTDPLAPCDLPADSNVNHLALKVRNHITDVINGLGFFPGNRYFYGWSAGGGIAQMLAYTSAAEYTAKFPNCAAALGWVNQSFTVSGTSARSAVFGSMAEVTEAIPLLGFRSDYYPDTVNTPCGPAHNLKLIGQAVDSLGACAVVHKEASLSHEPFDDVFIIDRIEGFINAIENGNCVSMIQ